MTLDLTIPGLPSLNSAAAPHWRVRHAERKSWKAKVAGAVLSELGQWPKPFDRARVTLTRCSTTQGDADNIHASMKFVLDGLKLAGVIADDGPQCIDLVVRWERAPRGMGCVRITVEPIVEGVEIGPRVPADPSIDLTGGLG